MRAGGGGGEGGEVKERGGGNQGEEREGERRLRRRSRAERDGGGDGREEGSREGEEEEGEREEEEGREGEEVAGVGGRIGAVVYPVFGRPRSPPPVQEVEEPDTATVRVPLGQLLLEERASAPPSGEQADEDGVLDGVPAETYCLWSPGSPAPAVSNSPARCQKSGSTGSVLRWRQRLIGRSHSDGKEKFVFLSSGSDVRSKGRTTTTSRGDAGGRGGGWRYYASGGGNGGGRRPSFLPYKQDLVGLFANAGAFRRSYHPF